MKRNIKTININGRNYDIRSTPEIYFVKSKRCDYTIIDSGVLQKLTKQCQNVFV